MSRVGRRAAATGDARQQQGAMSRVWKRAPATGRWETRASNRRCAPATVIVHFDRRRLTLILD